MWREMKLWERISCLFLGCFVIAAFFDLAMWESRFYTLSYSRYEEMYWEREKLQNEINKLSERVNELDQIFANYTMMMED